MNKQTKELNRVNNELDKQIAPENREAYTDIICYLRGAKLSEYNQETVRGDLLEMILSAQMRGEGIQTVIGEDYQAFCDNIITSLPPQSVKEKTLEYLDIVCGCLSILGVITIIFADDTFALFRDFAAGRPLNFEISISAGSVISTGIILAAAVIIVEVLLKNSFKIGKKETVSVGKAFLIGAGIMVVFMFIERIGRAALFTVNIFVACVITLVLYIIHRILAKI